MYICVYIPLYKNTHTENIFVVFFSTSSFGSLRHDTDVVVVIDNNVSVAASSQKLREKKVIADNSSIFASERIEALYYTENEWSNLEKEK